MTWFAGGGITVEAAEAIVITGHSQDGLPSGITAGAVGATEGGRVLISAPTVMIEKGGVIEAATSLAGGKAANIEVRAGRIMLSGGARIASGSFGGSIASQGGDLTVEAAEAIVITGHGEDGLPSILTSSAGGQVFVSAPTVTLRDGALIASNTSGPGRGGDIRIVARHIQLSAGGTIEARSSGGDIRIVARHIQLSAGGTIEARSNGRRDEGTAGAIRLHAGETFRSEGGHVRTDATRAGGGAIELRAGRLILLRQSELTASVRGGGGDAGNLSLTAPFIVAQDSRIVANAFGGQGGNIRIGAEVYVADATSVVEASSTLGIQGMVDVQAPVADLSGAVIPLPREFQPAAALLQDRCAARRREARVGSLVVRGRSGVPPGPDGALPSRLPGGGGALGAERGNPRREAAAAGRGERQLVATPGAPCGAP